MQFLRAVSHSVGANAVPEDGYADSDAEDDDEVHNDSDSDQPQSAVIQPQSQHLCEVCLVQQRDTRLAFVPCGHSLNNKLAVTQYAALTSAWSCVRTSGSDMLLKLTMYCLRTIRTVFLSLRFAFFFSIYFNKADAYHNDVCFTSDNYVR